MSPARERALPMTVLSNIRTKTKKKTKQKQTNSLNNGKSKHSVSDYIPQKYTKSNSLCCAIDDSLNCSMNKKNKTKQASLHPAKTGSIPELVSGWDSDPKKTTSLDQLTQFSQINIYFISLGTVHDVYLDTEMGRSNIYNNAKDAI